MHCFPQGEDPNAEDTEKVPLMEKYEKGLILNIYILKNSLFTTQKNQHVFLPRKKEADINIFFEGVETSQ